MHTGMMPEMELRRLAAVFVAALVAGSCQAQEVGWAGRDINHSKTELIVSPYTYHFSGTKGHSYVVLAGAAAVQPSGYLYGGALFNNSFGQPSAYVFVGQEFVEPWNLRNFYYTMTVGLIYGYKGAHKDEIKPNVAWFLARCGSSIGLPADPAFGSGGGDFGIRRGHVQPQYHLALISCPDWRLPRDERPIHARWRVAFSPSRTPPA